MNSENISAYNSHSLNFADVLPDPLPEPVSEPVNEGFMGCPGHQHAGQQSAGGDNFNNYSSCGSRKDTREDFADHNENTEVQSSQPPPQPVCDGGEDWRSRNNRLCTDGQPPNCGDSHNFDGDKCIPLDFSTTGGQNSNNMDQNPNDNSSQINSQKCKQLADGTQMVYNEGLNICTAPPKDDTQDPPLPTMVDNTDVSNDPADASGNSSGDASGNTLGADSGNASGDQVESFVDGTNSNNMDLLLKALVFGCLFFILAHNDVRNMLVNSILAKNLKLKASDDMSLLILMLVFVVLYLLLNRYVL